MSITAKDLQLEDRHQLALAASYLQLMNAELARQDLAEAAGIRDEYRQALGAGPLGPLRDGLLELERNPEHLEDLLHEVSDTPRSLVILVELCGAEPFAAAGVTLDEERKRETLEQIAVRLGGRVDEDDVELIFGHLDEAETAAKGKRPIIFLVLAGGAVGVLTGGLAAPAIGAAIGGAMGLSGAAATSAGLALLGGGAIATGGLGMAGGTALLVGLGGLSGAGVGALGTKLFPAARVSAEAMQLFALTRCLDAYVAAGSVDANYGVLSRQCRAALGRLIPQLERAHRLAVDDGEDERADAIEQSTAVVKRLRKRLGDVDPG